MDILNPDLMWIGGRCYRVNVTDPSFNRASNETDEWPVQNSYEDNEECVLDEPCDAFELEKTENGRYRISFHVARAYFPFIIGSKGATRKRLENETKTQIRVPKFGQEGDIVIIGPEKKGVSAARRRIDLIILSARHKQPFTHFLSIPFTLVEKSFIHFKEQVLEKCPSRGIDSSIFQTPEKLHLTLGTMFLADGIDRKKASDVLEECKKYVIDPALNYMPLILRMKGVEYMNDDPAEVDVLYGKVQSMIENISLQQLIDDIVEFFVKSGVMEKQYEQVKLHVTLMNTLFREDKNGVSEVRNRKQRPRESFDATAILKMFNSYDFGEILVDHLHLSQRYTVGSDGYYQHTSFVSINMSTV